jgi:hypothetical protein
MRTVDAGRSVALMAAALAPWACLPAQAAGGDDKSSFEIYGFAQLDGIQDTKRVDPLWEDAFRPSKIAAPEGEFGTNGQTSMSVKQSRFGVKGEMPTGADTPPVSFKFEFDFFGTGVDAGQTTIRLRYFYGEWGQLLAGQTTSLFMDLSIFPNVIDYWGPNGMVFLRDPQLRWTFYRTGSDTIAAALEKPSNDIDPGNIRLVEGWEGAVINGDETVPDLTGQWRHDDTWGHFQIAGILRKIGYEYSLAGEPLQKSSQTGWGVNLTAGIKTIGKDQLLLGVVHGNGIASYMNDGGMDLAPTALPSGNPAAPQISGEAVPMTGVSVYYDHYWNSMWSSAIGYSFDQVTNTNFQNTTPPTAAFHKGEYASVNLLAYPADRVMIGGELLYGKLYNNGGTSGNDVRFQFSVKYSFDKKL